MANNVINLGKNPVASFFKSTDSSLTKKETTLPIDQLVEFASHPFKSYDAEKTAQMIESIKTHGILTPVIVRPYHGRYEIIAGHNRTRCAKLAGLTEVPVSIAQVDDDTATLMMIETNFMQRETILPSERAYAYKMQVEALTRQGTRTDLTFSHDGKKWNSYEEVAKSNDTSRNQIHRYLRLTFLIPELLEMVDDSSLSLVFGVDLSYLNSVHQSMIFSLIQEGNKLTAPKLTTLKVHAKDGKLTTDIIETVMTNETSKRPTHCKISYDAIERFHIPEDEVEDTVVRALEKYFAFDIGG